MLEFSDSLKAKMKRDGCVDATDRRVSAFHVFLFIILCFVMLHIAFYSSSSFSKEAMAQDEIRSKPEVVIAEALKEQTRVLKGIKDELEKIRRQLQKR